MTPPESRQVLQTPSRRALSPEQRQSEIDKICSGFVARGQANRQIYRAIIECLLPEGAGIPGPIVSRQGIRDAIDRIKPGYKDVFRRLRELQGEEGLHGIIKEGVRYQLVSLAVESKREPRKVLGSDLALQVSLKQGGRCAVCGTPVGVEGPSRGELDHRVPRSRGGDNAESNLQSLCTTCNNQKSSVCTNCSLDCYTCPWAFPEEFRPIRLSPDLVGRLNQRAKATNQHVDEMVSSALTRWLRSSQGSNGG